MNASKYYQEELSMSNNKLDTRKLRDWFWKTVCSIKGYDEIQTYKDYILSLFLKRISDVFEDAIFKFSKRYEKKEINEKLIAKDHNFVSFYLPENANFGNISKKFGNIPKQTTSISETDAVMENPKPQGLIDVVDLNVTVEGQSVISNGKLKSFSIKGYHSHKQI